MLLFFSSSNTEWRIFDTCAANSTIQTSADLDWWVVTYVIQIKRNSLYHIFTLLMPAFILSLMSMFLVHLSCIKFSVALFFDKNMYIDTK
jgi:hypothetical protein